MIGIYFSGTGNSKYCLEYFFKCYIDDYNIFSVEEIKDSIEILKTIDNDRNIFISYPIYFSTIPRILNEFIDNNGNFFSGKKVFIIATMNMFSGDGAGLMARKLKKYNADIIGSVHLNMPEAISDKKKACKTIEYNSDMIKKAKLKIEKTADLLKKGKPSKDGLSIMDFLLGFLSQRAWIGNKDFSNRLKIDSNKCIGCEKCVKLCPMKNLKLNDEKKAFPNHNCTLCYRCVNECPVKAITLFGNEVFSQYHINDCLKQL
ncbi:EFR1 family ferrodoxin [uncultured Brachyspira sp.]|uniref:EFR1 family ferrodoxin n=1 Tax=uncultured Brachyspira sp. TaxID=221953 RepID=UPI00260F9844|nr:EFR1 family ferrodoxin [uncultured Brachyspira sp.]